MTTAESFAPARAVADAVLYEGYLLYPYRRSSAKNRVRWQFGILAPRPWLPASVVDDTSVAGSADAWRQQTECLLEPSQTCMVSVCLRFLHMRHRSVQVRNASGYAPVDQLTVSGQRHLTFDEAVPREYEVDVPVSGLCDKPLVLGITVPGEEAVEPLGPDSRILRTSRPLHATLRLSAVSANAPFPLVRLRVEVENIAQEPVLGAPRTEALGTSLIATHCLLGVQGGRFLSLLDPPEWAAAAATTCKNVHTFPVLAGDEQQCTVMLSSPILMDDHPRVAPESPGNLFDATEIDEILSLRTLTLTDEEKREARATDPRAGEIIDRVDTLPREVFGRLHGTIRSLRPLAPAPDEDASERPWWEPGGDEAIDPEADSVLVGGVPVAKGSRVRLKPRRNGTDVHDVFLAGRAARVEAVLTDVDGSRHVAVSLEDDPGADLHAWYGRHYHFAPEELSVLEGEPETAS